MKNKLLDRSIEREPIGGPIFIEIHKLTCFFYIYLHVIILRGEIINVKTIYILR